MKISLKTKNIFFQISAILILAAAIIYNFNENIAKYMLAIGAAGFAVVAFTSPYPGKSLRGKRLFNLQVLAVILMVVSAFLMFMEMPAWIFTLLIAAILTLYSSVMLPRVYKQEQEQEKKQKN